MPERWEIVSAARAHGGWLCNASRGELTAWVLVLLRRKEVWVARATPDGTWFGVGVAVDVPRESLSVAKGAAAPIDALSDALREWSGLLSTGNVPLGRRRPIPPRRPSAGKLAGPGSERGGRER
jgi:hypothetical protein